jgi:Helix-turn-helix domain
MRQRTAAWRVGVSGGEFRELEEGTRSPTFETWDRICKLYGRPQTFVGSTSRALRCFRKHRVAVSGRLSFVT